MKMTILLFICAIVATSSKQTKPITSAEKSKLCDGVHVRGKLHKRLIIMNGLNRPYQLAINTHEHQIFFSYNDGEDTQDTFGIAYVYINLTVPVMKLNYTEPRKVHGIKEGFAVTIDEPNEKVYFGGSDGIYDANIPKHKDEEKNLNLTVNQMVTNRNIWDIFYHKDHLYFIEFPSLHLYKYDLIKKQVAKHEHINEKIYQFVIDGEGDIFMTTKEGLYGIKNGTNKTIHYTGPKIFRAIAVSHKGGAYFAAQNGIYVADKSNMTLNEIASIKNIFGLTFDAADNIIYSNPHEIILLLPHDCK